MHARKAFTLIELLVVIAIIAILAAILFPVFAQAKESAKKASDLANKKQLATAVAIYLPDYDDTYPLGYRFTPNGSTGTWRWNFSVSAPIGWMGPSYSGGQGQEPRMSEDRNHWSNSIMPYMKNGGIFEGPGQKSTTVYSGVNMSTIVAQPYLVNAAYNGLLHAYNATAVVQPADVPLMWGGNGGNNRLGNALTIPALNCPNDISAGPCIYMPKAYPNGLTTGPGGYMFVINNSMWQYSRGVNWTFCDTHAKFRRIGSTPEPATNDPYTDPNVYYNTAGWTTNGAGTTGTGYFWTDGYYPWLFRPDYVP